MSHQDVVTTDTTLPFRHDCADCRKVQRFKVGQNLYQSFNTRKVGPNWRKAIDSWFNEIDGFPSSSVSNYKFNHKTGHYSQLVWARTSRIGCGSIAYRLRLSPGAGGGGRRDATDGQISDLHLCQPSSHHCTAMFTLTEKIEKSFKKSYSPKYLLCQIDHFGGKIL